MTGKLNSEEFVQLWNKINSYKVTVCKCKSKLPDTSNINIFFFRNSFWLYCRNSLSFAL